MTGFMAYTQKQNNSLWILKVPPVEERGFFLANCIPWLVMSIGQFICEEMINNSIQCPTVFESFVCSSTPLWAACSESWPVLEKTLVKRGLFLAIPCCGLITKLVLAMAMRGVGAGRRGEERRGGVWRWQLLNSLQLSRYTGTKETLHWESVPWLLYKSLFPWPPWHHPVAFGWRANIRIVGRRRVKFRQEGWELLHGGVSRREEQKWGGKDGGGDRGTVSVVSSAIKTLKDAMVLPIDLATMGHNSPGCLYRFSTDSSGRSLVDLNSPERTLRQIQISSHWIWHPYQSVTHGFILSHCP